MRNGMTRFAIKVAVLGTVLATGMNSFAIAQQTGAVTRAETSASTPGAADPMEVAKAINMRRSELYKNQDVVGAASLYTEDASYIELMPILQVFKGRDQIKGHFNELVSASAASILPNVLKAETRPDGTMLVSGDYEVILKAIPREDIDTSGHFMQILRQENGEWRISMHVFARRDAVTDAEVESYRRD